jgi:hypothetical protein
LRKLRFIILAALVAAIIPLPSHAGDANQHTTGTALLPTRFAAGDPTVDAYPGVQRRVDIATMGLGNGLFGYVFPIDQFTWCDEFTLKLDGAANADGDLDIYFYDGWDDIIGSDTVIAYPYEHRAAGGETGWVPPDTTRAMVFSYNAVNASFTYDAVSNGLDECDEHLPPAQ